jgi:hypothetical protein
MRRFEVGSEQLEEAGTKVREAIRTEKRPIRSVSDLVRSFKKEISAMRKRGDSWEEIRRILSDAGVTVSRAALARNAPAVLEEGPSKSRKSGKQTQKEGKEVKGDVRNKLNQAGTKNVIERVGDSKADEAPKSGVGTFRIRPDRDDL